MPPAQQRPQGTFSRPARPPPEMVTPSKPERAWIAGPARQQPAQTPQNSTTSLAQRNTSMNHPQAVPQGRPTPGPQPQPQQFDRNSAAGLQSYSRPTQELSSNAPGCAGTKSEASADSKPQQPNTNSQGQSPRSDFPVSEGAQPGPEAGFYSARAVDILRGNPQAPPSIAPKFDPHAESPSIRKTAGIDHSKSIPVSRPMLSAAPPSANSTRDFINPSADMYRRVGAPGGNGIASPAGRPQGSSYRPLTRPNIDPRNAGNIPGSNRENPALQHAGLKRPPLNDVTNASLPSGTASASGPSDLKRPKVHFE
jgi:DNA repair and recombination protein RAD52